MPPHSGLPGSLSSPGTGLADQPGTTAALSASDEAALLATLPDPSFVLDREGQLTCLNEAAEKLLKQLSIGATGPFLGRNIWQDFPDLADSAFSRECQQALAERCATRAEAYYPGLNRWFAILICPAGDRLCVHLRDVTERAGLERQLRRLEVLTQGDGEDDGFLTQLAHEVRNALAPVRNALHLVGLGDLGPDAECARALAELEVRRLSTLIEDLLAASHPPSAGSKQRINLTSLLAQTLARSLGSGSMGGRNLTLQPPSGSLWVEADPRQLEQILIHLLDNAVRGTAPGGNIRLTAEPVGTDIVVRLHDDATALAPEVLQPTFNPLRRQEGSTARFQWGLGLGLRLVRRLLELHGGSLEVGGSQADRGREFIVRLPRAEQPSRGAAPAEAEPSRALEILVAEDSLETAQSLKLLLGSWGCTARVVYDGIAALEAIRAQRPDLVLLDIDMPGKDGYEVAESVRREEKGDRLPLVALTGYGEERDRERAREAGFDYHMLKPVDPADLLDLIRYLQSAAQQLEQAEKTVAPVSRN